jgi:hypothetical protein
MELAVDHHSTPLILMPLSGLTVRAVKGVGGRRAFGVYAGTVLVDVSVTTSVTTHLLRGGLRGRGWAVAWGRLSPDQHDLDVVFAARMRADARVRPVVLSDSFWMAEAAGRYRTVAAAGERATLRRFRHDGGPTMP